MTLTTKDWRAIAAYAQAHELKPQLSLPAMGMFMFLDNQGQETKISLLTMKHWLDDQKKRDKEA